MNKALDLLLECHEARFNTDIRTQVKKMKDDFLARLVGIPKDSVPDFRKGFEKFIDAHTQFQSLKKALMAYLPKFRSSNPLPPEKVAA